MCLHNTLRALTHLILLLGTYQPNTGNDTCAQCPAGYECTSNSSTPCSPGSFSTLGHMTCDSCSQGSLIFGVL